MRLSRFLLIGLILLLLVGGGLAIYGYQVIYGPNIAGDTPIDFYVRTNDEPAKVIKRIKSDQILTSDQHLDFIADKMSYLNSSVKPGRYILEPNMSTYDLINKLRLGQQTPVQVTIKPMRKIEDLAGYLGQNLEFDSLHYLQTIKTDETTSICDYLTDTYEFYWSTDGKDFKKRMKTYSDKFWSDKNLTILNRTFTPCEVITLASIVEKETAYIPEKPTVAGLYIRRLNRGMLLQADPTVIYSVGDFSIRRVLNRYLNHPSPYNTYVHTGLPPGPICMPSRSSINAVLNAEDHEYIYMCAKADNSGTHAFAETLAQHNRNARAFQRWLNNRGIRH